MTEAEWLHQRSPNFECSMAIFLEEQSLASARKMQLYACACCRRIWDLLDDDRSRAAVAARELAIESEKACIPDGEAAWQALTEYVGVVGERIDWEDGFACAMAAAAHSADGEWMLAAATSARAENLQARTGIGWRAHANLLRDIFGNPFRPVAFDPAWRSSTVAALADAIYAERAFDRLPILADALEDAGCTSGDVLEHCRQPGAHVRGCWVVDLVLGKS